MQNTHSNSSQNKVDLSIMLHKFHNPELYKNVNIPIKEFKDKSDKYIKRNDIILTTHYYTYEDIVKYDLLKLDPNNENRDISDEEYNKQYTYCRQLFETMRTKYINSDYVDEYNYEGGFKYEYEVMKKIFNDNTHNKIECLKKFTYIDPCYYINYNMEEDYKDKMEIVEGLSYMSQFKSENEDNKHCNNHVLKIIEAYPDKIVNKLITYDNFIKHINGGCSDSVDSTKEDFNVYNDIDKNINNNNDNINILNNINNTNTNTKNSSDSKLKFIKRNSDFEPHTLYVCDKNDVTIGSKYTLQNIIIHNCNNVTINANIEDALVVDNSNNVSVVPPYIHKLILYNSVCNFTCDSVDHCIHKSHITQSCTIDFIMHLESYFFNNMIQASNNIRHFRKFTYHMERIIFNYDIDKHNNLLRKSQVKNVHIIYNAHKGKVLLSNIKTLEYCKISTNRNLQDHRVDEFTSALPATCVVYVEGCDNLKQIDIDIEVGRKGKIVGKNKDCKVNSVLKNVCVE